jgi:hypothetical protein
VRGRTRVNAWQFTNDQHNRNLLRVRSVPTHLVVLEVFYAEVEVVVGRSP